LNNILKKVCAGLLSLSFLSMQSTFAEVLTTGNFAGSNVLNNVNGGAVISGHTSGLSGVNTDGTTANLNFNNNTRIDWSTLNVGNGQTLNFQNGNYAVLNNVLNGMSTFAGRVTGQNGAIIISNPNGMLLNGGQFETSGSIILTTKNLLGIGVNNLGDNTSINNAINSAGYNNGEYHIISIGKNGSTTSTLTSNSSSINIISKGINIDGANLTANGSDGILLTTSDGQNFIGALNKNGGVADNINFGTNSIQIANSSIKSNGGDIKLVTTNGGDITAINNNTITAPNINVNSAGNANLNNVTAYNSITGNASGNLTIANSTANTTSLTANKDVTINNLTSHGSLIATSTGGNLSISGATTNTSTLTANKNISINNLTSYGSISATSTGGSVNLSGATTNNSILNANKDITINNLTSWGSISATAGNNIYESDSSGTVTSNQMTLNAGNTINLVKNYPDYCKVIANAKNIGISVIGDYTYGSGFGSNTTLNATEGIGINATGNLTVKNQDLTYGTLNLSGSNINLDSSNFSGNLIATTAGNIITNGGSVTGNTSYTANNVTSTGTNYTGTIGLNTTKDATFTSSKDLNFVTPTVGGNLSATTSGNVNLTNGTITGNTTLNAINATSNGTNYTGTVELNLTKDANFNSNNDLNFITPEIGGKLTATTTANINVTNGGSISGDTILTAGKKTNVNIGSTDTLALSNLTITNSTNHADGNINVNNIKSTGDVNISGSSDVRSDIFVTNSKINGNLTTTKGWGSNIDNTTIGNGLNISGNSYNTSVTNSNITGDTNIATANRKITLSNDNLTGNLNINKSGTVPNDTGSDLFISGDTVSGNVTTNSGDWTIIQGLNANNIDANANGNLNTSWINAGNVNLTSKNSNTSIHQVNANNVNMTASNGTASYSWSNISGDTKSTAKNITMVHSTITGDTNLNASNDITINSDMNYNTITANAGDNISLARTGDYTFNNDGSIVLNAANQLSISATKNLVVNNGVFNALTTNLSGTNITTNNTSTIGNLIATTAGNIITNGSSVTGTTSYTASSATSNGTNYTGTVGLNLTKDANFTSNGDLIFITPEIGGKLTATTTGNISTTNGGSITGDTSLNSAKNINVNVGSTDKLTLANLKATTTSTNTDANINVNNISTNNVELAGNGALRSNVTATNSTVNGSFAIDNSYGTTIDNLTVKNGTTINANKDTYITNGTFSNGLDITGKGKIDVRSSEITGNTTAKTTSAVFMSDDNIDGNLTANADDWAIIQGVNAKDVNATTNNNLSINGMKANNVTLTSNNSNTGIQDVTANNVNMTADNGTATYSWSTINGDTKTNAKNITMTNATINGDAKLNASNDININDSVNFNTINANAGNNLSLARSGNYTLNNDGKTSLSAGNNLNITATKDLTINNTTLNATNTNLSGTNITTSNTSATGNLIATTAGNIITNGGSIIGTTSYTASNTTSTGTNYTGDVGLNVTGNASFNSNNDLSFINPEIGGTLIATTLGNILSTGGTIGGASTYTAKNVTSDGTNYIGNITLAKANNVSFTSNNNLNFTSSKIDGTLDATSTNGAISIRNNNGYINGDTTLNAKGGVDVISTLIKNGDLTATSTNDKVAIQSVTLNNGDIKTNSKTYTTFRNVKANNLEATSQKDINFYTASTFNNIDLNAATNVLVDKAVSYNGLKAIANDITLNRSGDFTLGAKEDLRASNNLNVNVANGGLTVDNKTLNSSNINLTGDQITSNNSNYNGNTAMTATNTIGIAGTNNFNGTLNAKSTNAGNITINGNQTTVKDNLNITTSGNVNLNNVSVTGDNSQLAINNAYNINVNNTKTGKLSIINPDDSLFNIAEIANTQALTTEFVNGNSLIIDLTTSSIFGNNRTDIKNSASNVNELLIYPIENTENTTTESNSQSELAEEATKIINTYKASGINTVAAQGFTPIAFAANDNANSSLIKNIGNVIYRDLAGVVHITDRLNLND